VEVASIHELSVIGGGSRVAKCRLWVESGYDGSGWFADCLLQVTQRVKRTFRRWLGLAETVMAASDAQGV
jgi:hypothetical protein